MSGGGGKVGVSGTGREFCAAGAFFVRGTSRGRLFNRSVLSGISIADSTVELSL